MSSTRMDVQTILTLQEINDWVIGSYVRLAKTVKRWHAFKRDVRKMRHTISSMDKKNVKGHPITKRLQSYGLLIEKIEKVIRDSYRGFELVKTFYLDQTMMKHVRDGDHRWLRRMSDSLDELLRLRGLLKVTIIRFMKMKIVIGNLNRRLTRPQ